MEQPTTVSVVIELPEPLHESLTQFIEDEGWTPERFWQAAASLMLMQNGPNQPHVNSLYLDSLFGCQP